MLQSILKASVLNIICWNIILLFLVWQILLSSYSIFSNIALLTLYIFNYQMLRECKRRMNLLIIWGLLLLVSYSIILQNEIPNIVRFSLVLFFVLGAYLINLDYKRCLKSLFFASFSLCIALIISEILLLFVFGDTYSIVIRNYFIDNGLGDVYFSKFYYKIQIRGNAIIPFVYMLSYAVDIFPLKRKKTFRVIYLLAIGVAGNFAYLLAVVFVICVFYFYNIRNKNQLFSKLAISFILLLTIGGGFFSYANSVLEEKKEVSNAIRIEQATLLLDNLNENPITLLGGQGLGNTVDVITSFRSYVGATYYELQVLYILNQLGAIPFLIFILVNIFFIFKYMPDIRIKIVYAGYILYAVTNPYIIDTNQVVVIITLLSAQYQISNHLPPIWKK